MSLPDHLMVSHDVDYEEDSHQLNSRLRYLNRSLDGFWKRWRKEYLLELREAHCHHRSYGESQLSEGDIVVVYSDDQPRSCWKLGRIEKMIVGVDGQKRAATVRVSKKGRISTLDRPIQHLYPLEVSPQSDEEENTLDLIAPTSESGQHVETPRPKRSAATMARDRILAQAVSGLDIEP